MVVFSIIIFYVIHYGRQVVSCFFDELVEPLAVSIRLLRKIYRVAAYHSSLPYTFDLVNVRYRSRPCGFTGDAAIIVATKCNLRFCFDPRLFK